MCQVWQLTIFRVISTGFSMIPPLSTTGLAQNASYSKILMFEPRLEREIERRTGTTSVQTRLTCRVFAD